MIKSEIFRQLLLQTTIHATKDNYCRKNAINFRKKTINAAKKILTAAKKSSIKLNYNNNESMELIHKKICKKAEKKMFLFS